MTRGKTRDGGDFPPSKVDQVWEKAIGSGQQRIDVCRTEIRRGEYGQQTEYGWEIDHIIPLSRGGKDDLDNLQPLHWENNRDKADQTQDEWDCGR